MGDKEVTEPDNRSRRRKWNRGPQNQREEGFSRIVWLKAEIRKALRGVPTH